MPGFEVGSLTFTFWDMLLFIVAAAFAIDSFFELVADIGFIAKEAYDLV